ncbi:MAG TPA: pyridoxal 5'-phosphate synthase glutaminase subunit PdxT [Acidimicrobiales bacterium]|nr:pyridoxal 5'-phosphate synthase glutaminase subunit PdxT [Acidimicrobiales bacterium]
MAERTPARRRRVGVLALQGDVREHFVVLERLGASPVEVRSPSDVAGIEALVLPGGESTTMSMLLDSSGLSRELEQMVADGLPMLGTCAGMILLAREVLDGRPDQRSYGAIDLAVRRNGFGRQVASFETDLDVKGLDEPMHAVFIRAPLVERTGTQVEVLAEVDLPGEEGRRRPVVCAEGNVIVSSFHPELAGDGRLHEQLLFNVEGD